MNYRLAEVWFLRWPDTSTSSLRSLTQMSTSSEVVNLGICTQSEKFLPNPPRG